MFLAPAMVGFACAIETLIQGAVSELDPDAPEPLSEDLLEAARLARDKLADRLARGNSLNERALAAVAASMTNIVSGFLITDRMLKMFRERERKP